MRILALLGVILLAAFPVFAAAPAPRMIAGTVTNHTGTARPVAGIEVKLTTYANGAEADWKTVATSPRGEFAFTVPADPQHSYAVQVKYKGGEYDSPAIVFEPGQTARRVALRVFEPTSDASVLKINVHHIIVEAGEGMVQVAELLVFANTSNRTYIGGAQRADGKRETLRVTLPQGAAGVQYMDGLMECCVFVTDAGFVDTMDVEPGMREIAYSYTVPSGRGSLALTRRLDYPAERVEVFGSRTFAMGVSPLQPQEDVKTDQGAYARFSSASLAAGTEVRLALSGLPVPRSGARRIAIAAFAGIVAAALAYPLLRRRRTAAPSGSNGQTREEIIAAVASLDDRFEAGEIPEAEYRERRARYMAKLRRLTAA